MKQFFNEVSAFVHRSHSFKTLFTPFVFALEGILRTVPQTMVRLS